MSQVPEYEVRCPSCDVSFPVGTKKCLHCGGRTAKGRLPGPRMTSDFSPDPFDAREPEHGTRIEDQIMRPQPVDYDDEDEEPGRKSGILRSLMTLVWIGVAVAISMARACQEN